MFQSPPISIRCSTINWRNSTTTEMATTQAASPQTPAGHGWTNLQRNDMDPPGSWPCGKHTKNDGKIHHCSWENPLFLWWFFHSYVSHYQRVHVFVGSMTTLWWIRSGSCLHLLFFCTGVTSSVSTLNQSRPFLGRLYSHTQICIISGHMLRSWRLVIGSIGSYRPIPTPS